MCGGLALWLRGKASQVERNYIMWEESLNVIVVKRIPTRSFDFSFDSSACVSCQIIYDEVAKVRIISRVGMKKIIIVSRKLEGTTRLECCCG